VKLREIAPLIMPSKTPINKSRCSIEIVTVPAHQNFEEFFAQAAKQFFKNSKCNALKEHISSTSNPFETLPLKIAKQNEKDIKVKVTEEQTTETGVEPRGNNNNKRKPNLFAEISGSSHTTNTTIEKTNNGDIEEKTEIVELSFSSFGRIPDSQISGVTDTLALANTLKRDFCSTQIEKIKEGEVRVIGKKMKHMDIVDSIQSKNSRSNSKFSSSSKTTFDDIRWPRIQVGHCEKFKEGLLDLAGQEKSTDESTSNIS